MRYLSRVCFFIALISIEWLSLTSKSLEIPINFWDKFNHFIAFFTLYLLLSFSFRLKFLIKFALLFAFGLQIELVQSFLPYRYFSVLDMVANLVGILAGAVAFRGLETGLERMKFGKVKDNF